MLALVALALVLSPRALAQAEHAGASGGESQRQELEARRARVLAIAASYASHVWHAGEANRLHGPDPDGVQVDTPDAGYTKNGWTTDGAENVGVPYAWGGFSSLEEFDRGLAAGRFAGHLPRGESAGASRWSVGVDCSGFLSRCWGLPRKQSTRSLGALCNELADYSDLRPGDLINSFDGHAVLFLEHLGPERVRVVEAGFPKVSEATYTLEELRKYGLRPLRYKPLDEGWRVVPRSPTSFELAPAGDGSDPTGRFDAARSAKSAAPPPPLADAHVGEWTRYRSNFDSATLVRQVAFVAPEGVELELALEDGDERMETSETRSDHASTLELLESFDLSRQRLSESATDQIAHERGKWTVAGRTFSAWRTRAHVTGAWVVRHQRFPATIEIELVQSEEVPVDGLLRVELRYVSADSVSADGGKDAKSLSYELVAFGD